MLRTAYIAKPAASKWSRSTSAGTRPKAPAAPTTTACEFIIIIHIMHGINFKYGTTKTGPAASFSLLIGSVGQKTARSSGKKCPSPRFLSEAFWSV